MESNADPSGPTYTTEDEMTTAATLREHLAIHRISTMKTRTHAWWHRDRCEACRTKRSLIGEHLHDVLARALFGTRDEEPAAAPPASATH